MFALWTCNILTPPQYWNFNPSVTQTQFLFRSFYSQIAVWVQCFFSNVDCWERQKGLLLHTFLAICLWIGETVHCGAIEPEPFRKQMSKNEAVLLDCSHLAHCCCSDIENVSTLLCSRHTWSFLRACVRNLRQWFSRRDDMQLWACEETINGLAEKASPYHYCLLLLHF